MIKIVVAALLMIAPAGSCEKSRPPETESGVVIGRVDEVDRDRSNISVKMPGGETFVVRLHIDNSCVEGDAWPACSEE